MSELLSVIFYTANIIHEPFAGYVRGQLLKSIDGEFPLIVVSHKPMPGFGDSNVVVDNPVRGHLQIYRNILLGAKAADTEFVGLAEDDAMMTHSHWRTHFPPLDKFAYDFNKWGVNTWMDPPVFGYRARMVINHLIAPRELLIESLEERFAKFKDVPESEIPLQWWGDLGRLERTLGVTPRKWEPFAAPEPGLVYNHQEAFGYLNQGERKSVGKARRDYLWPWGSASDMLALWNEK